MKWGKHIVAALVVLCATFLVSTIWLYVANDAQQRQFSLSNSSSAWVTYQTQIEYLNLEATLHSCVARTDCQRGTLKQQLYALAFKLDLLIGTKASDYIPNIEQYTPTLTSFAKIATDYSDGIDVTSQLRLDNRTLVALVEDMQPLGNVLQAVLSEAVLHSADIQSRDAPLAITGATSAFLMLVLSGAGLMIALAYELRQGNVLLDEIRGLRETEREAQTSTIDLLEALPVPILVIASNGSVSYANRAAKLLASPPHGADELGAFATTIKENFGSFDSNGSALRNFPLFCADGSLRHLAIAANGIRLLGDNVKVYAISDNTLLRDAELRAMTASRLAILGELSSAIAHELNQPLAVIKAAASNGKARAQTMSSSLIGQKFVRIDEQVERARKIIDNVRKLARPNPENDIPFTVTHSLGSALGLVSQQYRLFGICLELEVNIAETVMVIGNPTLFEIAILNILLNAREAFQQSSSTMSPTVRLHARLEAGALKIVISDNAGGIPPHILPRIFESFVSSKSVETGTGLGLSIARRTIDSMRGSIEAANDTSGAVFSINLPAVVKEALECQHQLS
jgi:signal transduction histidine kinase